MSPVLELPPASIEMENFREKSASISVTDTGFMYVVHKLFVGSLLI
jgi:hypothetical protein